MNNVIYFIKLFQRNILWLIITPFIMAVIVILSTMNMPRKFTSTTTIYTGIATGSSIVSLETSKLDLFGTRTAFDNLINLVESRSTAEEVGLLLFTSHMLIDKPNPKIISAENYKNLQGIVPKEVKNLVVKGDATKTYQNFQNYMLQGHNNFIYELLGLNHPHYSTTKILQKLKASRIQSSDMIKLQYSCNDPGICTNTLTLFNEVFMKNYAGLKMREYNNVVKYFQEQLALADKKLHEAENELLQFNKSNNIINYYEQTKHIASEKEHFNLGFSEIQREFASSESVLKALESKMDVRQRAKINSSETITLRNQLSETKELILSKKTEAVLDPGEANINVEEVAQLEEQAFNLEQQLRETVDTGYYLDNSIEGLSSGSVLQEWLDKVIEYESTKAAIEVSHIQNQEYRRLFQIYAPLGATMKRLERKIDVIEREYLSILHSLGLAKLKQKNVELNSSLRVIDKPRFSLLAQPSKRKFLIIIAFMVGVIIPAFIILLLEFIDGSIRNASRAEKLTDLKVLSMIPKPLSATSNMNPTYVKEKSANSLISKFLLLIDEQRQTDKQIQSVIVSNDATEGKTFLTKTLVSELTKLGYKSLHLTPNTDANNIDGCTTITYKVDHAFHKISNVEQLLPKEVEKNSFDFIFIEFPHLLNQSIPVDLIKDTNFTFMVVKANRSWSSADKGVLTDYLKATNNQQPHLIVNGVEAFEMEETIGKIPTLNSFIKSLVIKIVRFRPFSKKAIA